MKKGISLISLIITIIVVIILAAIAVFTGFRAVDKANLAKFAQEVSDYEAAVQNDFYSRKTAYAISGGTLTDDQIYAEIAGNAGADISTVVGTLSSKNFYHGSDSGVFAFIRDYGGGYFYTGFRVALVP